MPSTAVYRRSVPQLSVIHTRHGRRSLYEHKRVTPAADCRLSVLGRVYIGTRGRADLSSVCGHTRRALWRTGDVLQCRAVPH